MLKPAFQIEVSSISEEEMLQSRLLVEVNADSFTYVLLNQRNMSPLVVKYFKLEHTKGQPLTESLREILQEDELLKRPVKETLLVYNFPESSLVPEPLFSMGNWGPELVELAGGAALLGVAGEHSVAVPWQTVRDADPDVLVVAPCGFGLARAEAEMHLFGAQPGWRELRAVRSGRVFVADGNLYFNRSSPSLFDTPGILAEMLHPAAFAPAHEGTAWRRWDG